MPNTDRLTVVVPNAVDGDLATFSLTSDGALVYCTWATIGIGAQPLKLALALLGLGLVVYAPHLLSRRAATQ